MQGSSTQSKVEKNNHLVISEMEDYYHGMHHHFHFTAQVQGGPKKEATMFEGSHLLFISSKCLNQFP